MGIGMKHQLAHVIPAQAGIQTWPFLDSRLRGNDAVRSIMLGLLLIASTSFAQERPNEADMFGAEPDTVIDAGEFVDAGMRSEEPLDAGIPNREDELLTDTNSKSKFDTAEAVTDPLKIGGNLLIFGQAFFRENQKFESANFSAPSILDVYLDARPSDRIRAYAQGRLQYDPTKPAGDIATQTTGSSTVGLTQSTASNPAGFLDQLWLRFDIARTVFVTVGRQKVRWGVSRVWYPTDYLNSRPRDALNPFDARLGVNMVKLHLPIESLGWNFYAYGLLDSVSVDSSGITLGQLGGALRGEFVLGKAEISLSAVWQKGRRPRYAADISAPVGPFDLYAEAAIRDGRDFVLFKVPTDLTGENVLQQVQKIEAYRPENIIVQVTAGASLQFNYTDKNFAILGVEYFYNPAGYNNVPEYLVKTFLPGPLGLTLDPIQNTALYGGKHNVAITLAAPGIPGADWITLSLSNIIILNDPSALTRIDAIFRVLNFLSVQAFAGILYGQTGGQIRFSLSEQIINDIAGASEARTPGAGTQIRNSLGPLKDAPVLQAGLLLRVSI
jgi:hypothetical protein